MLHVKAYYGVTCRSLGPPWQRGSSRRWSSISRRLAAQLSHTQPANRPPDVVAVVGGGERLVEVRPGGWSSAHNLKHAADETKANSASSDCDPLSTAWQYNAVHSRLHPALCRLQKILKMSWKNWHAISS